MRFAYADPPYPGQAKRHYVNHPDYAGEVDHQQLVEDLVREFDGWALSTSAQALRDVLGYVPAEIKVRVLSWCKPIAPPMRNHGVFGWEPVLIHSPRVPPSDLKDWLVCSPEQYTFRPKPDGYVTGSKPPAFSRWVFAWLGVTTDDEFVDLFPGSRAVSDAHKTFVRSLTLF